MLKLSYDVARGYGSAQMRSQLDGAPSLYPRGSGGARARHVFTVWVYSQVPAGSGGRVVVAFVRLFYKRRLGKRAGGANAIELADLFVSPAWRRRGIATELVRSVLRSAPNAEDVTTDVTAKVSADNVTCFKLFHSIVSRDNIAAITVLLRCGFEFTASVNTNDMLLRATAP